MGIINDISVYWLGNPPKKQPSKYGNLAECIKRDDEEQARRKAKKEYQLEPIWDLLDRAVKK